LQKRQKVLQDERHFRFSASSHQFVFDDFGWQILHIDGAARAAEEADDEVVGLGHDVETADDPAKIDDEMVSSSS